VTPTKDEQIKDLQAELDRTAKYAEKVTRERDSNLKRMNEMLEAQGASGNWNYDEYMHGLYNGMEFMLSLAENREPKFRDAPEEWLKDRKPIFSGEECAKIPHLGEIS